MATLRAASLLSVLLFLFLTVFCSDGETNIIAEPGQNVILPCRAAENKPVIVLEWSRTDLGEYEHVYLYQDDTLNYDHQHPAYKDRIDLQDREMKDGDVSLVLNNVMINDTGTYECRVVHGENKRRKRSYLDSDPICTINLDVSPPGDKDKLNMDEETNSGLIVGPLIGVVVVLTLLGVGVGVGFLLYKRRRRPQQEKKARPAAGEELQFMNAKNGREPEKLKF